MSFEIQSASDNKNTKMNYVIYGDHSVKPITLAKQVDKALVISVTGGVAGITGSNVDYIQIEKHSELIKLIQEIKTQDKFKDYEWIFFDNITELGQNIYPLLRDKMDEEATAKGSKGADGRQVWGRFAEMISRAVKGIRSINKNTVVFAGVKEMDFDGLPKRMPDVYGKSAERIISWYDEVFYMLLDSNGERKFVTRATDKTMASDTSDKLDAMIEADLKAVHKILTGAK